LSTKKALEEMTREFIKNGPENLDTPEKDDISHLRVIKTARDEKSINQAVAEGFFPLLKQVVPSSKIRSKYAVLQNGNPPEKQQLKSTLFVNHLIK
jgi:hypothetical protein